MPRPQPSVTVKVRSGDLQRVVESGKLKLKVRTSKASLTVGARAKKEKGSIALGSKKVEWDGGEGRVVLKLSDSAREALGKRESAKVIATVTADHGGGHTERVDGQAYAGLTAMLIDAVEWLGHSGFRLRAGRTTIYIDPYRVAETRAAGGPGAGHARPLRPLLAA